MVLFCEPFACAPEQVYSSRAVIPCRCNSTFADCRGSNRRDGCSADQPRILCFLGNMRKTPNPMMSNPNILRAESGIASTPPIPYASMIAERMSCPRMTVASPAAIYALCSENEMPVMIEIPSNPDNAASPTILPDTCHVSGPSRRKSNRMKDPAITPPKKIVSNPVEYPRSCFLRGL